MSFMLLKEKQFFIDILNSTPLRTNHPTVFAEMQINALACVLYVCMSIMCHCKREFEGKRQITSRFNPYTYVRILHNFYNKHFKKIM